MTADTAGSLISTVCSLSSESSVAVVVIGPLGLTTIRLYGVAQPGPMTRSTSVKATRAELLAGSSLTLVGPVVSPSAGTASAAISAVAIAPATTA